MAGGFLGAGICHASTHEAAQALCASLAGPTAAGMSVCTSASADAVGATVLEVVTAPASGPQYLTSIAYQLPTCYRIDSAEIAPIFAALAGLAVLLATMSRLPRIFESRTYGGSD